jgi:glycerophosphoryl diester phosphodiesterase
MGAPQIFAHRGASGLAPENTRAAFQLALEAGVDGIEVDVQLTGDRQLVICHDEEISRVSNGRGKIRDYTLEALNRFDFGSWFDARYGGQKIMLLDDLFNLVRGRETMINVEIKGDPGDHPLLVEKLALLLERYQMEWRVIVSSFFHSALSLFRQRSPRTSLGVLYECGPLEPWLMAESVGAGALHPRWRFVTQELVAQAHERGYRINAWTLDSAGDLEQAMEWQVDGIVTNNPDLAIRIREIWRQQNQRYDRDQ